MPLKDDNADAGVLAARYARIKSAGTEAAVHAIRARCLITDLRAGQRRLTIPEAHAVLTALAENGFSLTARSVK